MAEKYFKKEDSQGRKCELFFNNTHFVNTELLKKDEWKPFEKVGELTDEGIEFIESKMKDKNPMLWENYNIKKC